MKRPIKIYVTTCKKMAYLLKNFDLLFQRFWGGEYIVFGETVMKPYSDQLIDFFSKVRDEYFILLHEDFYFVDKVDTEKVARLVKFAKEREADRVGLQCITDGYEGATNLVEGDIYQINDMHNYTCSFEASIWKREFLLERLVRGEDPWQTEVNCSMRARGKNKVFTTKERTCEYRDAFIHGQPRIKLIDGSFHQLVPGDTWEDLKIKS